MPTWAITDPPGTFVRLPVLSPDPVSVGWTVPDNIPRGGSEDKKSHSPNQGTSSRKTTCLVVSPSPPHSISSPHPAPLTKEPFCSLPHPIPIKMNSYLMVQTLRASLINFFQGILGELYHLLYHLLRRLGKRGMMSQTPPSRSNPLHLCRVAIFDIQCRARWRPSWMLHFHTGSSRSLQLLQLPHQASDSGALSTDQAPEPCWQPVVPHLALSPGFLDPRAESDLELCGIFSSILDF